MDDPLRAEHSYRNHYERAAAVDRDGWKRARSAPRRHRRAWVRASIAKALVALAAWLTPTDAPMPSIEPAPDMGGS